MGIRWYHQPPREGRPLGESALSCSPPAGRIAAAFCFSVTHCCSFVVCQHQAYSCFPVFFFCVPFCLDKEPCLVIHKVNIFSSFCFFTSSMTSVCGQPTVVTSQLSVKTFGYLLSWWGGKEAKEDLSSTLNHFTAYKSSLCLLPVTPFLTYFCLVFQFFLVASDGILVCTLFGTIHLPVCCLTKEPVWSGIQKSMWKKCNYNRLLS